MIYGASETGKSFILDSIDYALGTGDLREIVEANGYTRILLGIRLPDGETITLSRAPGAKKIDIFDGDLRRFTTAAPKRTLAATHSGTSKNNLSHYLLTIIGADGRNVRTNAAGKLRTLSFRDLAHLCLIDEGRMADERSPVLVSGQYTNRTVEKSIFRFLLTGDDESDGPTGPSDVDKKVGKGKLDLLDQLITTTETSLTMEANATQLLDQLTRLEATLASSSAAAANLVAQRSAVAENHRALDAQGSDNRRRAEELQTLLARFGLLRQQYESDLARLQMVAEAGNLLGYFRTGPCVFCGATPEHQQPGHHLDETTQLQAAVTAETRKTNELHADLLTTIEDLEDQLDDLDHEHSQLRAQATKRHRELATYDERLAPLHTDTKDLLAVRSQIHAELAIHAQIQRLHDVKASLTSTAAPAQPARSPGIPAATLLEFERKIQQTLQAWKVPGDSSVSYDQSTAEITVDGRPRHTRGKGMRSIIHAAFTTALASYATQRNLTHPGFVVLDSPVLTYREPHENDTRLTHNVVEHFYRGLLNDFPNQVVVIENGDPPNDIDAYAQVYPFSTQGSQRVGFFPAQNES
ncbi:hypothetical protein J7E99_02830 [Streptomyces sp. ISL-44]|nr:hypothetical protein [Streptomyces sp. ISL-44]MBT2539669.1 hypothetical protein [Streptomyces sp. ISL-44]